MARHCQYSLLSAQGISQFEPVPPVPGGVLVAGDINEKMAATVR